MEDEHYPGWRDWVDRLNQVGLIFQPQPWQEDVLRRVRRKKKVIPDPKIQIEYHLEVSPKCRRSIMYRENVRENVRSNVMPAVELIRVEAPELIFVTAEMAPNPRIFILVEHNGDFFVPRGIPNYNVVGMAEVCLGSAMGELLWRLNEKEEPLNVVDLFWNSVFTDNHSTQYIQEKYADWNYRYDHTLDHFAEEFNNQHIKSLLSFLKEWKQIGSPRPFQKKMVFEW